MNNLYLNQRYILYNYKNIPRNKEEITNNEKINRNNLICEKELTIKPEVKSAADLINGQLEDSEKLLESPTFPKTQGPRLVKKKIP